GADPFDGDLEVFGGAAVHVHRDVVVQPHHDAVLTECVGHGVGAGVDVVGAAVDLDGEGDARAGFLQQVVRHVPGNLAAAGGLVPRGGAVGEHVRGAVHRGMEGFLLGI